MNPEPQKLFTADQLLAAWREHRNETNGLMKTIASEASIRAVKSRDGSDFREAEIHIQKMETVAATLTNVEAFLVDFLSPSEP